MDAWASSAEEGRGTLRKAPVRRVQPNEPEMSEWGNPAGVIPCQPQGGEPGELKHLSSPRKREDSASSGERKRSSLNRCTSTAGLKDSRKRRGPKTKGLGRPTREGESPVVVGKRGGEDPE